MTNNRPLLII